MNIADASILDYQNLGQYSTQATIPGQQPLHDIVFHLHQNLPEMQQHEQAVFSNGNYSSSPDSQYCEEYDDFLDSSSELTLDDEEGAQAVDVKVLTFQDNIKCHDKQLIRHEKDNRSTIQQLQEMRQYYVELKVNCDAREEQLSKKINDDLQKVNNEIEDLKTETGGLHNRVSVLEDHFKVLSSQTNTIQIWMNGQETRTKLGEGKLLNSEAGALSAGPSTSAQKQVNFNDKSSSEQEQEYDADASGDDNENNVANERSDPQMPQLSRQIRIHMPRIITPPVPQPQPQLKRSQRIEERQANAKKSKVSTTSAKGEKAKPGRTNCEYCNKDLATTYVKKHIQLYCKSAKKRTRNMRATIN